MYEFTPAFYAFLLYQLRNLTAVAYLVLAVQLAVSLPMPFLMRELAYGLVLVVWAAYLLWVASTMVRALSLGLGVHGPYMAKISYLLDYLLNPLLDWPWQRFLRVGNSIGRG